MVTGIIAILIVCVIVVAMAKKGKSKKRRSIKDPILSALGWEGTYLSLGKAILTGAVTYAPAVTPVLVTASGTMSPAGIMLGQGVYSTATWTVRLHDALVCDIFLITGHQLDSLRTPGGTAYFKAGTGAFYGKVAIAGAGIHMVGKTKLAKKLTRGLPLKM